MVTFILYRQKISTVEERIEDARKQLYIQSTVNKTQPDKTVGQVDVLIPASFGKLP